MKSPSLFSTSKILAALMVAFFAGTGMGYIVQQFLPNQLEASVIQHSSLLRRIASSNIVDRAGELMVYHTDNDGDLVEDKVADDPEGIAEEEPIRKPEEKKPISVPERHVTREAPEQQVDCSIPSVDKPVYSGEKVDTKRLYKGIPGESAIVTLAVKNTGNVPWFSDGSGCRSWTPMQLGTTRERDRVSIFANNSKESGWLDENRIALRTLRVDPGTLGIFEFAVNLPRTEDIYREYFALVVPGVQWLDETEMNVDFIVGESYERSEMLKKFNFLNDSSPGRVIDLNALRKVKIDLSEQTAYVKLGDYVVRKFLVSSGTKKNPTPVGSYTIGFKQYWRIGTAHPYYIMPKFMGLERVGGSGFRGYGFHALPSLGNAALRARIRALGPDTPVPTEWFTEDSMWTEARDHIGTPRSHGCVRFLPENQDFVFDFLDIGGAVEVIE